MLGVQGAVKQKKNTKQKQNVIQRKKQTQQN
jgi:hypothetical protein